MKIDPPKTVIGDIVKCPFCEGSWELMLNESYNEMELIFICQMCQKKFIVRRI